MALRFLSRWEEVNRCVREPDFHLLYSALGDRGKQDLIRSANPEVKHCKFLLQSSDACNCLPSSAGEYETQKCPNNPHSSHKEIIDAIEEHAALISEAQRLGDEIDMGLLPGAEGITPEQFEIARIMKKHRRMRELEMQARMIGF